MAQIFGRNSFINAGEERKHMEPFCAAFQNSARLYSVSLARSQQRDRKSDLSTSDGAFSQNHFDIFEEAGGAIEIPLRYDHAGLFPICGLWTKKPRLQTVRFFIHDYKCGTTDLPAISIQLQRGSGNRENLSWL